MLFINGTKSTVQDVIELVNKNKGTKYDYNFFKKKFDRNPEYELNPATKMIHLGKSRSRGHKIYKEPKGSDILSYFKFYSAVAGEQIEVRYTDVMPYKNEKTGLTVNKPKSLDLAAPFHALQDAGGSNIEKMLFTYLHPSHSKSPFHKAGSVYKYTHIDHDEKHQNLAAHNAERMKVLNHIQTLDHSEIIVYAKALGLDVSGRTSEEVVVIMQEKAFTNANTGRGSKTFVQAYVDIMNDESLIFSGYVQDAIDNKQIVSNRLGQSQIWRFDLPSNKRELCSTSVGEEAVEELVAWMKGNPTGVIEVVLGLVRQQGVDQDFKNHFAKAKNGETTPFNTKQETDDLEFGDISSYKTAGLFMKKYFGKSPSPVNNKAFHSSVESGEITAENWEEAIQQFAPVGQK